MKVLVFVAIILIAAAALFLYSERAGRDAETAPPLPPPAAPEADRPPPRHPVSEPEPERAAAADDEVAASRWASLPALADSDEPIRETLASLIGEQGVNRWLVPDRIIERTVATVNSLDKAPIPLRFRPLRHIPGLPAVIEDGERILLAPENARRYEPLMALLERVDPDALVELYLDYYPLFQEAFEANGIAGAYFNDRLVEVIDHLLAAPEIAPPVELVRPDVFYEFADPALETSSFGRKILIRAGPENAERIKAWLRAFRARIADVPFEQRS